MVDDIGVSGDGDDGGDGNLAVAVLLLERFGCNAN